MKKQAENLIKYVVENYKVDGTVFVERTIANYSHAAGFEDKFKCSIFIGIGQIEHVEANTMLNLIKLVIATLDAKGLLVTKEEE